MSERTVVIDGGARGHAIARQHLEDPEVSEAVVSPGNPGMRRIAELAGYPLTVDNRTTLTVAETVLQVARDGDIIEIAQDDAAACGMANLLGERGHLVCGPSREASRIEWHKGFAREEMHRLGLPSPEFKLFTLGETDEATAYARDIWQRYPGRAVWFKAAGLCGGKGALKCRNEAEITIALTELVELGDAGQEFVVELGLEGPEASLFSLVDGTTFRSFRTAQDYKRAYDGDRGGQTGGMGAFAPSDLSAEKIRYVEEYIIAPLLEGLRERGTPFVGTLYTGIIDDPELGIQIIEFNARPGDPEAQALVPGLKNYHQAVRAAAEGRLIDVPLEEDDRCRVYVVGAAKGYPEDGSAAIGKRVFGIEDLIERPGIEVFSAGLALDDKGNFVAGTGGRLFGVLAEGRTVMEARGRVMEAMRGVAVAGGHLHFRRQIALDCLENTENGRIAVSSYPSG